MINQLEVETKTGSHIHQRLGNLLNARNIVFLVATMLYLEKEWIIYERENTPDSIVPLFVF